MGRQWHLAAGTVLVGCAVADLDLQGKRCPCAAGWVCELATSTCVLEGVGPRDGGVGPEGSTSTDGGTSEAGGGTCDGGLCPPLVLASGLTYPVSVAVDATSVYWIDFGGLHKEPSGGGAPVLLSSTGGEALLIRGGSAYWTTGDTIQTVPVTGGATTMLVSGIAPLARAIAADAMFVYWASAAGIVRMPLAGGPTTTLATNQQNVTAIAVDSTNVYWATVFSASATVMKAPLTGGSPVMLAPAINSVAALAVDSSFVYWADLDGINAVPLAGGSPTTLAGTTSGTSPLGLTIDPSNAYWTSDFSDLVVKTPLGIGGEIPIAGGKATPAVSAPWGIAVDANFVYWTNIGAECLGCGGCIDDGSVMRHAK
jgi:hypothetical protein